MLTNLSTGYFLIVSVVSSCGNAVAMRPYRDTNSRSVDCALETHTPRRATPRHELISFEQTTGVSMKKTLVILASALSMSAAFAQTAAPAGASGPAMSVAAPASASAARARHDQRVEQRIAYLHSQLKITSQQDPQWNTFADVMRSNSEKMGDLFQQRKSEANDSALDNMKQYAEITQAHADGTKRLVDAFEPLYTSLSPEQKKLADTTFRNQPPEGGKHHRGSARPAAPASDPITKP